MALEFNKVVAQVQKMSAMLEALDFDERQRLALALERFRQMPDLEAVHERIDLVRQSDISGYRGAAPLDLQYAEPANGIYPPPPTPAQATIVAADGSQIFPNERNPVHYYLINIGLFVYHHGADRLPQQITLPELFYHKDHVHENGRVISNRAVDARRTVAEMIELSKTARDLSHEAQPLVALYDNRLLFWVNQNDVKDASLMLDRYHGAFLNLAGANATLAGYVDTPMSRLMMRLLFLMSMADADEIKRRQDELPIAGDLSGLSDRQLFDIVLPPGHRSALMVQNSPQNRDFRRKNASHEIAFFYIKVNSGERSALARVDIPMWVARDRQRVDDLHALLLVQSQMQGRNPYPYALTRADELAYVSSADKAKLDELINLELRRKGIEPYVLPGKAWGKELARGPKRKHMIGHP